MRTPGRADGSEHGPKESSKPRTLSTFPHPDRGDMTTKSAALHKLPNWYKISVRSMTRMRQGRSGPELGLLVRLSGNSLGVGLPITRPIWSNFVSRNVVDLCETGRPRTAAFSTLL